jgi:hypothetical protein
MIGKRRRPSGLSSSDIASVTLATRSGTKRSADNNTKHVDEAQQSKKKKITAATNDKEEHEEDNKKLDDDSKKWLSRLFSNESTSSYPIHRCHLSKFVTHQQKRQLRDLFFVK